ncbi:MAG: Spy/CpxP family protein refolding chaperone [Gallionella sp.]
MKNSQKMILGMFVLFGACMIAPVYAEDASSSGATGMTHQHPDPVAKVEKRLASFKEELKITSDQEQVWATYAEKTRSNVKDIRDRMDEAMHDKPQTAPERFDRHIELMKQRLASFEKMDDALKQLYTALTPEQKAIADRHFAKMHH